MTGILGTKLGMTQIFDEAGSRVSTTVIEAGPCSVLAVKEKTVQLGFAAAKEKKLKEPQAGFFKKLNVSACKFIREVAKEDAKEYKVGEQLSVDMFKPGDFVDVTGISIGKGFSGGMKRWHWKGGPRTHGSTSHRRVGSIGSTTTPGRVFKGHHMPGHLGVNKVTVQNLRVVKVDAQNNLLAVRGAVPGKENALLIIRKAKKKQAKPAHTQQATPIK